MHFSVSFGLGYFFRRIRECIRKFVDERITPIYTFYFVSLNYKYAYRQQIIKLIEYLSNSLHVLALSTQNILKIGTSRSNVLQRVMSLFLHSDLEDLECSIAQKVLGHNTTNDESPTTQNNVGFATTRSCLEISCDTLAAQPSMLLFEPSSKS